MRLRSVLRRILAATLLAAAVGGEKGRQRTVLVKTIQKRYDDGQAATAQHVRRKNAVFAAKYQKRNQNPKSSVTLRKAIHKKPPVFYRRGYVIIEKCLRFCISNTYYSIFSKKVRLFSRLLLSFCCKTKKNRV